MSHSSKSIQEMYGFRPFSMHTAGPTIGPIPNTNFDFFSQISKKNPNWKLKIRCWTVHIILVPGAIVYIAHLGTVPDGIYQLLSISILFPVEKNFAKSQILFKENKEIRHQAF
jgi:hypothetical protein